MFAHQLDIILPCYNPIEGWAETIIQNIQGLERYLPDTELFVVLVNDGSTSGISPEDIYLLQGQLPHFTYVAYERNQGKGFALRTGVQKAVHALCIYTDVDFPYYQDSFLQIYHTLKQGKADVAAGTRNQQYYAEVPGIRTKVSKLLRFFTRKLLHLPINDTQCGIKGFNHRGREIFLRTQINRYLFDLEFIFLAAKDRSITLQAVPVVVKPDVIFRKLNPKILLTEGRSFMRLFLIKLFADETPQQRPLENSNYNR